MARKEALFGGRNPLCDSPVFSKDIEIDGLQAVDGEHKIQRIFVLPDGRLLMITSDGIGAFDQKHKLPDGLPAHVRGKGLFLTAQKKRGKELAAAWGIPTDHVSIEGYKDVIPEKWWDRASVHEAADRQLLAECVARSGCEGSQHEKALKGEGVCGHELPPGGLTLGQTLPYPMFTPTTKEQAGKKDRPITIPQFYELMGYETGLLMYGYTILCHLANRADCRERELDAPDEKVEFGWYEPGVDYLEGKLVSFWQPGMALFNFNLLALGAGFEPNALAKMPHFDMDLFLQLALRNAKSGKIRLYDENATTDSGRFRLLADTQRGQWHMAHDRPEQAKAYLQNYLCKEWSRLRSKETGMGGYDKDATQEVVLSYPVMEEQGRRLFRVTDMLLS